MNTFTINYFCFILNWVWCREAWCSTQWHSGRSNHKWNTVCLKGENTLENNLQNVFCCCSLYQPCLTCHHQAGDNIAEKEHVTLLSSSDHSDIVTLGDAKEDEHVEVEEVAAAHEEFYLGTSCSSQYAFSAAETGKTAAPHTVNN